jgi:glycosyltransferase involved in cell wall biosynthesis
LNTDLICFFDSDDLVHPQRNEILLDAFKNDEVKVLVHDLYFYHGELSGPEMIENLLKDKTFTIDKCKNGNEFGFIEKTNLLINYHDTIKPNVGQPENSEKHLNYANGHITIRKEIFEKFKYEDISKVEDTQYNLNLLKNGYKFSHISDPLMIYRP